MISSIFIVIKIIFNVFSVFHFEAHHNKKQRRNEEKNESCMKTLVGLWEMYT